MNSDAVAPGIGYAHTMPSSARQPRTAAIVTERWERKWLAPCSAASKLADDPILEFGILRHRYHLRIGQLFRAEIAWTTILRGDLDSPLTDANDFTHSLALAIERRRSRMNRVKGRKREKYSHVAD